MSHFTDQVAFSANSYASFFQEFYKKGTMTCTPNVTIPELREACDYLLIPFDAGIIKCQNLCKHLFPVFPVFCMFPLYFKTISVKAFSLKINQTLSLIHHTDVQHALSQASLSVSQRCRATKPSKVSPGLAMSEFN